jgi:flagellar biosynthetic protein FliR
MDFFGFLTYSPQEIVRIGLIFLRVFTIFIFLPILGDQNVPIKIKISFSIVMTVFLYPFIPTQIQSTPHAASLDMLSVCIASFKEIMFGFAVGYTAKIIFFAASMAAQIAGVNMGFQVASMFNPLMNEQESSFSLLKGWIILVLLLVLKVHHVFIQCLAESFYYVPLSPDIESGSLIKIITLMTTQALILGLKIVSPIIAIQIMVNISIGLLNRALPALNVFVISFPLSFLLSMLILYVSLGSYLSFLSHNAMEKEVVLLENVKKAFMRSK